MAVSDDDELMFSSSEGFVSGSVVVDNSGNLFTIKVTKNALGGRAESYSTFKEDDATSTGYDSLPTSVAAVTPVYSNDQITTPITAIDAAGDIFGQIYGGAAGPSGEVVEVARDDNSTTGYHATPTVLFSQAELFPPTECNIAVALVATAKEAAARGARCEAFDALERAAAVEPEDLWIRNDLGHLAADLGRLDEAQAQFAFVLSRDDRFFHSLRGQARVARARGDPHEALRAFAAALEVEPNDPWVRWEIANLHETLGQLDEAEAAFRAILTDRSNFAAGWTGLARVLSARNDDEGGFAALCEGHAAQPSEPWLTLAYAKALAARSRFAEAQALLQPLADQGPAAAAATVTLYYLKRELGEDAAAAALLDSGLTVAPDDPDLLIAAAARAQDERRFDAAAAIYERLSKTGESRYWRLVGEAALARRRREPWRARRLFNEAIDVDSRAAPAYAGLCDLICDAREAERVHGKLDAWIAGRPHDVAPRLQKAALFAARSEHAAALVEIKGVLERWPQDVDALILAAEQAERLGLVEESIAWLERARGCAPENPAVLEALAQRAQETDNLDEAQRLLDLAIAAAPSRRWLRIAAVRLKAASGAFGPALDGLAALRARFGSDPEFDCCEAEVLLQTGQFEAASERLDEACARYPDHFRLAARKATIAAELGDYAGAAQGRKAIVPITQQEKSMLSFLEGCALMSQWRFEEAAPWLQAAVAGDPGDGWMQNRLVHCQLMLFEVEAAGERLKALAKLNFALNRRRGNSVSSSQTHYGQIYDEFRLDLGALREVRRALAEPDVWMRLESLRIALRRYPDYTPGAIAFLTTCRKAGLLARARARGGSAIPRRIAQFWDAPGLPDDLDGYSRSWRTQNPEFAYARFDAAAAAALLTKTPASLRAFESARQPAMKADIFRLAYLAEQGGVYADMDDRCRRGLAGLLDSDASLVLYQEDLGTVGNNFIAARPHHPVLKRAFENAVRAVNDRASDLLWLSTGPGALTRAVCEYVVGDEGEWQDRLAEIHILDRHEMLKQISIHCLCGYKSTKRHWSRTAFRRV